MWVEVRLFPIYENVVNTYLVSVPGNINVVARYKEDTRITEFQLEKHTVSLYCRLQKYSVFEVW